MTTHIINKVPDFPYKKHVFGGAALALDWAAHINPEHAISNIWEQVKEKAEILDNFIKPFGFKQKVVTFTSQINEWEGEFSKKSLELVREGTAGVKLAMATLKAVDKYALTFLTPVATTAVNSVSAGASLVASTALVAIRAIGLYQKSDEGVTGEKALIKASGRFVSSLYGLAAAIILVVALCLSFPASPYIVLGLLTLIFLTNLLTDAYVKM